MTTSHAWRALTIGLFTVALGLTTGCSGGAESEEPAGDGTAEGAVELRDDVLAGGGRFAVTQVSDGQWVWNLKARNGETVLQSERYASKQNAEKGIASVLRNIFNDARIELRENLSFAVMAKNGQEVGRSERYATASNRTRAIAGIRALVAGFAEQDSEAPSPPMAGLEVPTNQVLVVPAGDGFRIRLVDARGKLYARMPGGKKLSNAELEEWFFAFEGLTLNARDEHGLPISQGGAMENVQVLQGSAGWYFHFVDFDRNAQGLYERRILMTSPKTDYPSESAAREAAKAAMDVLDHSPMG
ncbi:MAG: DUF1508 domain-containing protein [Myxococcales bacterium]|nr:DUF1508 domain-containing protein [Myxococcales bacterium]